MLRIADTQVDFTGSRFRFRADQVEYIVRDPVFRRVRGLGRYQSKNEIAVAKFAGVEELEVPGHYRRIP